MEKFEIREESNIGNQKINSTKKNIQNIEEILKIDSFDTLNSFDISRIGLHYINEIKENRVRPLTFGKQGEIFKFCIGGKNFIILKKMFQPTAEKEFLIHKEIFDEMSKEKIFEKVRVPKPYFYTNDGENQYIMMEFIKGKTIYAKIISEYIKDNWDNDITTEGEISINDDRDADLAMTKVFNRAKAIEHINHIIESPCEYSLPSVENSSKKHNIHLRGSEKGKEIHNHVKEFLKKMHEKGFYHRDLFNIRNIMFDEDKIYIIDFGHSLRIKDNEAPSLKEIYEDKEQNIHYTPDENILKIINFYTRKKK